MIDLAHVPSAASDPRRAGEALMARFSANTAGPLPVISVQDWVNVLTSRLMAVQACSVAEHLFGVLPLIDAFFERDAPQLEAVRSGTAPAALGLFTPTPDGGWDAAAIAGEFAGPTLRAWGTVRIASHAAEGSIVLVQAGRADQRLAWVHHHSAGVELRGSRTGGPPRSDAPRWLVIDGAAIAAAHVSRAVMHAPGAELYDMLERYIAVWSLFALKYTRDAVRSLRRLTRTTRPRDHREPFSASQLVMMDLGELEIETELATIAATRQLADRAPHRSGLAVALAAARMLTAVAAKASELRDLLGLTLDGALPVQAAASLLAAHVGGALMLENELARALDCGGAAGQDIR